MDPHAYCVELFQHGMLSCSIDVLLERLEFYMRLSAIVQICMSLFYVQSLYHF